MVSAEVTMDGWEVGLLLLLLKNFTEQFPTDLSACVRRCERKTQKARFNLALVGCTHTKTTHSTWD